uniref:Uncharacterized protein n=1 Tax=Oryza nivara TaxID=4536 RepID=A0A0E0IXJ9_ORYNI
MVGPKGLLYDEEVAVKRVANCSHQGLQELKNELILVIKLQCCLDALIYHHLSYFFTTLA